MGMLDIIRQYRLLYCWSLLSSLGSTSLVFFDTYRPDSRYFILSSKVSNLFSIVVSLFSNVCISACSFLISSFWSFSLVDGFLFFARVGAVLVPLFFLRSRLCTFLSDVRMMYKDWTIVYTGIFSFFSSFLLKPSFWKNRRWMKLYWILHVSSE